MDSYMNLGYTKFLDKENDSQQQIPDTDFDTLVQSIDASKINQGRSNSNTLTIDYDEGLIERYEGEILRTKVGKFEDGKFGLRVYDTTGTVVIDSTA